LSLDRYGQVSVNVLPAPRASDVPTQLARGVEGDFPSLTAGPQANATHSGTLDRLDFIHGLKRSVADLDDVEKHIFLAWTARCHLYTPLSHQGKVLWL